MNSAEYAKRVCQIVVYGKTLSAKFPPLNEAPGRARGSGFFVRLEGEDQTTPRFIMTAAHVVEDAFLENGVRVILPLFGSSEVPAQIRILIPEIDFALLEIDPQGKESFIDAFPLGDDHDLEFGGQEPLLVLGYPLGQDQLKVLRCNFSGRQDVGLQTDCAMNKGNSGGPIVFRDKIVGWVSVGVPSNMANNVSWAVPINQYRAYHHLVLDKLKESKIDCPVIHTYHAGLLYHNNSLANSNEQCQGVVIQFVSAFSVLHGFAQPGDKLCSVESASGHTYKLDHRGEVSVPWYFARLPFSQIIAEMPVHESVTFHLWDGQTQTFKSKTVHLNNPSRGGYLVQSLRYEPFDYETYVGLMIMPLRGNHLQDFPQLRMALSPAERETEQLLITHIIPGSEAYEMGVLNPGDIIVRINDQPVKTMAEFRQAKQQSYPSLSQQPAVKIETRDHAICVLNLDTAQQHDQMYAPPSPGVSPKTPGVAEEQCQVCQNK